MSKKFLTRILLLLSLGTAAFFLFISVETTSVPIEKSNGKRKNEGNGTVKGDGVTFQSFDREGKEVISGASEKVTLSNGDELLLEQGLELNLTRDDKKYYVKADSFVNRQDGSRELRSNGNELIILAAEDGVVIETKGPLISRPDGVFTTESHASFRWGKASGSCRGLRYKPESFLHLLADAHFESDNAQGFISLDADTLLIEQPKGYGTMTNGVILSRSKKSSEQNALVSEEIEFHFVNRDNDFLFTSAKLSGSPAWVNWSRGRLESHYFEVCFHDDGRKIAELVSGWDARFEVITEDGYRSNGQAGRFTLDFVESVPRELIGHGNVNFQGSRGDGDELRLQGKSGLVTEFLNGKAYSTRILGSPTLEHGAVKGSAGNIRMLHGESKIVFADGAELNDPKSGMQISGNSILLTDINQKEQEIYAFEFVEIVGTGPNGSNLKASGSELELHLPDYLLKLGGEPAVMEQNGILIRAPKIEARGNDETDFALKAEGRIQLQADLENGPIDVTSQQLDLAMAEGSVLFNEVEKAVLPGYGELSCGKLQIALSENSDGYQVEDLRAERNIIFQGNRIDETGKGTGYTARADLMTYDGEDERIRFLGKDREITVTMEGRELICQELTYYINDGRMRIVPATHGTTKTTVPLKERDYKNNN